MKNYGQLNQEVLNLVSKSPARKNVRATSDQQVHHRLKLSASDIPELPAGCVVDVLNVGPGGLNFGDLVCGMQDRKTVVGRFLGLKGEEMELSVGNQRRTLRLNEVAGKVTRAEYQGKDFDPAHQSGFARLISRLTRYGTLFR